MLQSSFRLLFQAVSHLQKMEVDGEQITAYLPPLEQRAFHVYWMVKTSEMFRRTFCFQLVIKQQIESNSFLFMLDAFFLNTMLDALRIVTKLHVMEAVN